MIDRLRCYVGLALAVVADGLVRASRRVSALALRVIPDGPEDMARLMERVGEDARKRAAAESPDHLRRNGRHEA